MDVSRLPASWTAVLQEEFDTESFRELQQFVSEERAAGTVYPPEDDVFNALHLTPLDHVRVVILGQDPYHGEGQAHGLSFSVRRGISHPPSLRNILKELHDDLAIPIPGHGCLDKWAQQGVLLLNTVLTVRAGEANSHRKRGWESLTSCIIQAVVHRPAVAFVLWGSPAQKTAGDIPDRHLKIQSPHPSPLSAHRGFFGSRPFSKVNDFLTANGETPIDWSPDE